MELLKGRVCGSGPSAPLTVGLVLFDELLYALGGLFDCAECASANGSARDAGEDALDLLAPGAGGQDEVHVSARPPGQVCSMCLGALGHWSQAFAWQEASG